MFDIGTLQYALVNNVREAPAPLLVSLITAAETSKRFAEWIKQLICNGNKPEEAMT